MMNEPLQFTVEVGPVGVYRNSRFDRESDESMENGPVVIGDPDHANATDTLAVLFSRDGNQLLHGRVKWIPLTLKSFIVSRS